MKRIHFLEISDEAWCPRGIRRGVTDFCRFVTEHSGLFNAVAPLLGDAIRKMGAHSILDMGSGAGGPWLRLLPVLRQQGVDAPVCLTDHDPKSRLSNGRENAPRVP
jgi:hypothetical protein